MCKGTSAEGDDADARSVGRAVGRTRGRSDAPREEGGHRPVVTQGLEHEGRARRARDVGRGTWESGNGTCELNEVSPLDDATRHFTSRSSRFRFRIGIESFFVVASVTREREEGIEGRARRARRRDGPFRAVHFNFNCIAFAFGPTDERDAPMAGKKPTKRASSKKRSSAGRTTRSTPKSVLPSVSVPNPATMVMNLDVLGNARGTLTSLTSVSGVKAVLERVGMFGPATIAAWTKIEAEHFGGAGMGAMMKALGVRGPTGPLAPAAALFLLNPFWMYAQFLIGLGAIIGCGRGSDFPALFTATSMTLFASTLLAGSAHGTKDALVRNAMAFEYAVALLHVCTTSLARKQFAPKQITAIRKCAAAVPLLMMAFLKMQGASFAKFAAAGMSGPGVLGPVAGLLFHPLHGPVSLLVSLAYLSGFSTRRASFYGLCEYLVVAISITPQLVAPWNRMLTCLHIACACVLMRECVPTNSLIPKLR